MGERGGRATLKTGGGLWSSLLAFLHSIPIPSVMSTDSITKSSDSESQLEMPRDQQPGKSVTAHKEFARVSSRSALMGWL